MSKEKLAAVQRGLDALAVFRGLLQEPVIEKLRAFLEEPTVLRYGEFVAALYESGFFSLGKLVLSLCSNNENVYVKARGEKKEIPDVLSRALLAELDVLQTVSECTPEDLKSVLDFSGFLPDFDVDAVNIKDEYLHRTGHIEKYGYGIFATHRMFCLDSAGRILPVRYPDQTTLKDLVDYKAERRIVIDNTKALLEGKPAANILLTGDAGTGKSSTVKAVVNELYTDGIRIIEVRREQLCLIPALLDELASNPLKFILFIDDLSFAENDDNFGALKAVLEGSVCAKSRNVVIYATSNRRHIVREKFSDRDGDEIHRNDTMQEIVSLSERFGIHVTFQKPGKETYLHIVKTLAAQNGILLPPEELEAKAEQWALRRGGRSARLAKQLIDELISSIDQQ